MCWFRAPSACGASWQHTGIAEGGFRPQRDRMCDCHVTQDSGDGFSTSLMRYPNCGTDPPPGLSPYFLLCLLSWFHKPWDASILIWSVHSLFGDPWNCFQGGVSFAATARSRQFPTRQQGLNVTNYYRRKLDLGLRDGPSILPPFKAGRRRKVRAGLSAGTALLLHSQVGAWIFMWMLNQITFCLSASHMGRKNHEARIWIFLLLHTN